MKPTDRHDAVFAELEWYANGTLSAAERVRVRAHLAACAVCRSELQLIDRSMAAAVAAPQPDAAAVEQALARTLARIEREAAAATATVRPAGGAPVRPNSISDTRPGANLHATAGARPSPSPGPSPSPIADPVPWLQRWLDRAAVAVRAAASRPLMLGAATVAAISMLVVAPMALRLGGSDDYRVLTNAGQASAARVVLRVTFKAHTSPEQVTTMLGDAARDTTIERLAPAVYTLQLPTTAELDTVSRLHDRFARDATVDSVKLDVGAPR